MLTALHQTLISRLFPLGVPVYVTDCVPPDTPAPYITAEIKAPLNASTSGTLALTLWHHGRTAHADRLRLGDALLELLPCEGIRLQTDAGIIILQPDEPSAFVQEADLKGLRLTWTLLFFPQHQGGIS